MAAIDSRVHLQVPDAALRNVVLAADADADDVDRLLRALGIAADVRLPADVLLALGAWARLSRWESSGITLHREAGIASAEEVLRAAFSQVARKEEEEAATRPALWETVVNLASRRVAWTGQELLRADVTVRPAAEEGGDDELLDALSEFIWRHRHLGRQP